MGGGLLSGKYGASGLVKPEAACVADTRKGVIASTGLMNEASPRVAEEVKAVARATGASAGAGQPARAGRPTGCGPRGPAGRGQPTRSHLPAALYRTALVRQIESGAAE
jgi:hypothetical protein